MNEITDEMVEAGASYAWEEGNPSGLGWNSISERHKEGCRRDARNVLSAALAVSAEPLARTLLGVPEGYGAPHHDAGRIKPGDFVMQVDWDGYTRAGIAHHQDGDGDWCTENSVSITWAASRADRPDALTVWPAPTPPAEEVELSDEFGAVILNPRWGVRSYTRAVHLGEGVWAAEITPGAQVYTHLVRDLRSATLPDGTRARRDGEHANGEPRFVKVQESDQ